MRLRFHFIALYVCLASWAMGAEEKPASSSGQHRLAIRPQNPAEWDSNIADVEKVLYSSAGQLWRYFPGRELKPIDVFAGGGPITLFQRGPNGEIRVKLNTGRRLWAQMAFQFAHEMCHILCNYNANEHRNKWFEESLCEMSSLFVLRSMSKAWATEPPYPNWKEYAPHLKEYADSRIQKAALPEGTSLAEWYRENAEILHANALDRERNAVVAAALLPMFENAPENWEAVTWLNAMKLTKLHSFGALLEGWRNQCPEKHKALVTKIAKQFGIELPAEEKN